jgi:predicted nucleotidyltransferase component of viral defense system
MIKPGEIQQKAREEGVRDQQIEKDYVLSWILNGISQHEYLFKIFVFKGGTVFLTLCIKAHWQVAQAFI